MRRIDIRAILRDPKQYRDLMARVIVATQAREGIVTTAEQAEAAIDAVRREREVNRTLTGAARPR